MTFPLPPSPEDWERRRQNMERYAQGLPPIPDPSAPGPGSPFNYPDRVDSFGGDVYVVQAGDSWSRVASQIYGDEAYSAELMRANPRITTLHPGLKLVLPDRKQDPVVPVPNVDWWNGPDFAMDVNAMDEQRRVLESYQHAEQIWPDHGQVVYIGFDENNDPYPTADPSGMPLYWDPQTEDISFEDTGIAYTMGMIENDFIKPLTPEEQAELTLLGEDRFRPEAYEYYAQAAESGDFQTSVMENLPENYAYTPSLQGDPVATPSTIGWWTAIWDGISAAAEEPGRGIANIFLREDEKAEEPGDYGPLRTSVTIVSALAQTFGVGVASAWSEMRAGVSSFFGGGELTPYAVDAETYTKLSDQEVAFRVSAGRDDTIRYMQPNDYWQLELDRTVTTAIRFADAGINFENERKLGIYRANFETDEEYDEYIASLLGFDYGMSAELNAEYQARHRAEQHSDQETRIETQARMETLIGDAFMLADQGHNEGAIEVMKEALRLKNDAAHWYSPYFMWSELNEPWRYERFIEAVAIATLEHGEELEPRVVRDIRRRYEHVGVDLGMGIFFDVFMAAKIIEIPQAMAKGATKLLDLISGLKVGDKLADIRVTRPAARVVNWMFDSSHGAAATLLKRDANNVSYNAARTLDASLAAPGQRGLDEIMQTLGEIAKMGDQAEIDEARQALPASVTDLQIRRSMRLAAMYDEASELSAVQKINPDNWGQLVQDAFRIVWDREYRRALDDIRARNPGMDIRELEARAARHADTIASNPRSVSKEFGNFFEDAYRAQHRTGLGAATLDDNPIVGLSKLAGYEDLHESALLGRAFKTFYQLRNGLFEWWLGLRPAWTVINFIDSTFRSLVSGAKLFDALGGLWHVNVKRLLSRHLVREEFSSTFIRAIKEIEGDEVVRVEPAIDRLLRGRSFVWGPISVLLDARAQTIMELEPSRAARAATGGLGKVLRFIGDQLKIGKRTLAQGAIDMNSLLEFALRERVFATHFTELFSKMDNFGLYKVESAMREAGASDAAVDAMKKLWALAGEDLDAFEAMADSIAGTGAQGAAKRVFSELLPPDFLEVVESSGIDRRLVPLVIRPLVNDIEDAVRAVDRGQDAVDDVLRRIDTAIQHLRAEFTAQAQQLASQPAVISEQRVIGEAAADVADDVRAIGVGEGEEVLEIRTEALETFDRRIRPMSPEYYARGELQREAMGRLFDETRTLADVVEDGSLAEREAAVAGREYLNQVAEQTRLFRDNVKQFLLHVFPGPLRLERGRMRDMAWDMFDDLGVQVYDSVISFVDEAIEAARAGQPVDIPSVQNMLLQSGIELRFDGSRLVGFRVVSPGARTSFAGWRGLAFLNEKLLKTFFGPRARLRDALELLGSPFTVDNIATAGSRADPLINMADEFGEMVGAATDAAVRGADESWRAFAESPNVIPGSNLRRTFGTEATASRAAFLDYLEDTIVRTEGMIAELEELRRAGNITDAEFMDQAGAIGEVTDSIRMLQDEVTEVGRTIDSITMPPDTLADLAPGHVQPPRWMLDFGIQSYLAQQRGLAAEWRNLEDLIIHIRDYIVDGLRSGELDLTRLSPDDLSHLLYSFSDAKWWKGTAHNVASDGSKAVAESIEMTQDPDMAEALVEGLREMVRFATGSDTTEGAVARTQFDMLEYADTRRIDNIIKFVSPFWMFQSRSPAFWFRAFAQHPDYLSWFSKYHRQQRRHQMNAGAVSSTGRPLNRLYGYWRVPGTDSWVAPLNPLSARYVFPRPSPYPPEFGEDDSPLDIAVTYVYEYGRMFGFNPAPWITWFAYKFGALDQDRFPQGSLISHIELLPPWVQRDIRRALNMSRYPNDPGLINPDVGWQDYMIQKEMLGRALVELEENPEELPRIQAELYEAFGYQPLELNEFGAPVDYVAPELVPYRASKRWTEARDAIEKDRWFNQMLGFFTGIYPKDMTDAEVSLIQVRDEINFLKDSINSIAGVPVFGLDPVAESRYEMYNDMRWETPEGFINNLYGAFRWTQTPEGEQLYGDERQNLIAQRIWENEVTAAYYDSLEMATDEFHECQKKIPIGSPSALSRACWNNLFQARKALDEQPVFDVARKDWAIGYKTEQMVTDRFEHMWWRYVEGTKPHWYSEDGESWSNYQKRYDQWLENLDMVGKELAPFFLAHDVFSRTEPDGQIPGNRLLQEEAVVNRLLQQTSQEGYEAWRMEQDTPFDAMNAAFKALRWDPWMEVTGAEYANSYEKEQAVRAFKDKYGGQPTFDELARWVMENYPDRFEVHELQNVYGQQGVSSVAERTLPTNQRGVLENEVWDILSALGPGENFKWAKEQFILAGGDADLLDAWYETSGQFADYSDLEALHEQLQVLSNATNLAPPSSAQLVEWSAAKRLNDDFRNGVERALGEEIWEIIGTYGSLSGQARSDYKKANKEIIEAYYDHRDFFAEENQLWAKYYSPDNYQGGVGLAGEGAEKRGEAAPSGGGGGGRQRKASSGGGRGVSVPSSASSFIPMGYRSSYDVRDLFDPDVLGSGGVGGRPVWPPGFGKGKPPQILTEIVKLQEGTPLSDAAVSYLENQKAYEEYIEDLLKQNEAAKLKGKGGGVVKIM